MILCRAEAAGTCRSVYSGRGTRRGSEQAEDVDVVMLMNGVHGGMADEDIDVCMTGVEAMVAEWQYESIYCLRSTVVGMLPPDTPVPGFVDALVTCAMQGYE